MYRTSIRIYIIACIALLLSACNQEQASKEEKAISVQAAELVLSNAYIYTVDPDRSIAEALAVADGKIIAVGKMEDVQAHIGPDTEVHDLQGKMVMPGLHDAHIHALGIVEPDMCDLNSQAVSLEELVPYLQQCLERYQIQDGEWLVVLQWAFSNGNQPSQRYPNIRTALDAVSGVNPIILWGDDGHHAAVNSLALAEARDADGNKVGISAETIKTVFAEYREMIGVDSSGEPDGGLSEGVRLLVRPSFNEDMLGMGANPESVMPRVAKKLAASGITSIQDALVTPESARMYKWLEEHGQMTFRLRAALFEHAQDSTKPAGLANIPSHVSSFEKIREEYKDSKYIRAESVKLFADAVLEGNPFAHPPTLPVAAVLNGFKQPIFVKTEGGGLDVLAYADLDGDVCKAVRANPDSYVSPEAINKFKAQHQHVPAQCRKASGVLEHSEEFIREYVRQMTDAGFHLHIHALSDRAVRVAASAFAEVKEKADSLGLTQSFAHVQIAHPDDQRRIAELGIFNVFTYVWATPEPEYDMMVIPFIDEVAGAADLYNPKHYYMQNVYPTKSILDHGGKLVFGSDAPVGARDPMAFISMEQALTRANEDGKLVYNARQRLGIDEVIASYTINSANMFDHAEDLGSLEPGKIADIIVLDQNIVKLVNDDMAAKVGDTQVLMTIFDGKVVYEHDAQNIP